MILVQMGKFVWANNA